MMVASCSAWKKCSDYYYFQYATIDAQGLDVDYGLMSYFESLIDAFPYDVLRYLQIDVVPLYLDAVFQTLIASKEETQSPDH